MIYKTFHLKKIPDQAIFYLLYGKNEGLKTDCINQILAKNDGKVFNYNEKQIKDEIETFYENILHFYNITRDENSTTHAKQQRKLALNTNLDRVYYNFNSIKINT